MIFDDERREREGDSMVTDDERREVARRLREAASCYEKIKRDVDFYPVESALGLEPTGETTYTPESVRSLADLIDPDCRDESFCKVCGHIIPDGWSECPRCGSKVVSDD